MPGLFLLPDAAAATAWMYLLAGAALKGLVLLALAAGAARLLRRGPAAVRHALWTGAVLALLLMPAASRLVPGPALRILPAWLAAPTPTPPPAAVQLPRTAV